nr:MAG TPA: hypothetical protein [Caudoviricetes sp.]DAH30789.1 MAG TPA: hypothetical protein [Bacteriophage sp.]DAM87410.1 MAG TPA: hypothetical protein [Caudoviricetes sp.]
MIEPYGYCKNQRFRFFGRICKRRERPHIKPGYYHGRGLSAVVFPGAPTKYAL